MQKMETKTIGGRITEMKQEERNGVLIGIVSGYLASWKPDEGGIFGVPDRFHPGAFLNSIQDHKNRGDRQIRLKDHHGRTIGGFPIHNVMEDDRGLWGRGEINLGTQLGREAHALALQGVLTDFSIGFTAIDDKIEDGFRDIFEARVWEASIVDEPMNQDANITEVKVVTPFQDLPLAPRMEPWVANGASQRVKDFTESKTAPGPEYKTAFVWMDLEVAERFDGYKLQIADVIDGKLTAIPRAIFKAANEIMSRSAGIPDEDIEPVIEHLERYYTKMDLVSPFGDNEKQFFGVEEIKNFTTRDMEKALIDSGAFSRTAATELASKFNGLKDPVSAQKIMRELGKITI